MHYIKTNYVSEEEFSSDINMYGRIQSGNIAQKYEYSNKNVNRESDTNDKEEKLSENKGYESSIQGTTIDFNSIPTLNEDIEEDTYEDIGNTELSMLLGGSTTEATLGIDTEDTNNDDTLNEEEYEFFEDEDDYSDEDSNIEEEETYISDEENDEDDYDEYPEEIEEEEDYDEYSVEDTESDEDIYEAYDLEDASNEEDIEDIEEDEEDIEDEYVDEAYAEEDYDEYPEETNEGDYDEYEDEEISEVIEDYDEEYIDEESDEDYNEDEEYEGDYDEYENEEDEADYDEYTEDIANDKYYEEVSEIEDEVICNEHEEDKKEYSVIKDDNNDIENKVEEGYSIDTNSNICDEVPSFNIEDRDINLNKSSRENNSVEKCTNKVIHEADNNKNKEDEEIVDEDIPKNLVDFVRKFPKCDKSFALKYFSKKEIEENLLKGNINMYKNKLRL